jgi:hypothetical protein
MASASTGGLGGWQAEACVNCRRPLCGRWVGCEAHPLCDNCLRACHLTFRRIAHAPVCPGESCDAPLPLETPDGAGAALPPSTLGRSVEATPAEIEEATRLFHGGVSSRPYRIKLVRKVINEPLAAMFEQCRERFRKAGLLVPPEHAMRHYFHGAPRQASGSIIKNGFNVSFSGKTHGKALGPGIYTATDPITSHGYAHVDTSGGQCMFICAGLPGGDHDHGGNPSGPVCVFRREQQVLPLWLVFYETMSEK